MSVRDPNDAHIIAGLSVLISNCRNYGVEIEERPISCHWKAFPRNMDKMPPEERRSRLFAPHAQDRGHFQDLLLSPPCSGSNRHLGHHFQTRSLRASMKRNYESKLALQRVFITPHNSCSSEGADRLLVIVMRLNHAQHPNQERAVQRDGTLKLELTLWLFRLQVVLCHSLSQRWWTAVFRLNPPGHSGSFPEARE